MHVLPRLGDYQLRQLTTGLIEDDLVAAMEEARVGRATQRKALYLLQAILRYAVRRERIPYNPTEHVERPRQRTRAVRPIRWRRSSGCWPDSNLATACSSSCSATKASDQAKPWH